MQAHNFGGFDASLILKSLRQIPGGVKWVNESKKDTPNAGLVGKKRRTNKCVVSGRKKTAFSVMSKNTNCIRSMRFSKYIFKDSLDHLPASLENLTNNLRESNHPFNILEKGMMRGGYLPKMPKSSDPLYNTKLKERNALKKLLLQKSFYPYEWTTSITKLKKTKKLPKKSDFYSYLKNKSISDSDYKFAKRVFKKFKCKNMYDYCLFYVKLDTLLLSEIFQAYRKNIYSNFGIDACHFFGVPSLAQAICRSLQNRKDPIRLMHDPDMINLVINNIRGGIAIVNKRYSKSDPPYTFDRSDPNNIKPTPGRVSIVNVDMNALYGTAQTLSLPYKNFKFFPQEKFKYFKDIVKNYSFKSKNGFLACVDLEYPKSLHDLHDPFPVAAENVDVNYDMLSPYSRTKIKRKTFKQQKLIAPLSDRKNYLCHIANLQLYLKLGLKLTKIHKVIQFRQKPWIKKFIVKCTKLRALSRSKFYEDNWKLTANSCYGMYVYKIMETL